MPSILYVTTGTNRGGAEIQTALLATEMLSRDWKVGVMGLIPSGPVADSLSLMGIECQTLGMTRGVPSLSALLRLRRAIRAFRPDVVHAHMVHANILSRLAMGWGRGWPSLICTVHNLNEGGGWRPWAYRYTDRLAFRTTHVSSIGLKYQRASGLLSTERSLFIPNAVRFDGPTTPRNISSENNSSFTWLYVGRVEPVKRVPVLLQAFRGVVAVQPQARLVVVGGGSDEAELRQLLTDPLLQHSVELIGPQDNIRPWLERADGFVSLAEAEGMPLTVLEAGIFGLPVVTTDVGGLREIIPDASYGWLVDQSVPAATEAMLDVMRQTPAQRAAVGATLCKHVMQEYSAEHVMPQWLALYQQAMASRQ